MTLIAAFTSMSVAQTFAVQEDRILSNAGAPSVVHDGARFLMAYETPGTPIPGCVESWSIGVAQGTDGVTFQPTNLTFGGSALAPCGVRSPAVARTDDGHLVAAFEAVQVDGSVRIGIADQLQGPVVVRLVPALDGLRQPSIARFDGTWRILAIDPAYGLVTAESTDLVNFSIEDTTVAIGATPWSASGIESVSLGCWDEATWPWEAYYSGWSGTETGWAYLMSNDQDAWYVSAPIDLWADDSAWGGFEFITDGSRTAVYFDWTDQAGVRQIGVTVSGGAFPSPQALLGRDCQP